MLRGDENCVFLSYREDLIQKILKSTRLNSAVMLNIQPVIVVLSTDKIINEFCQKNSWEIKLIII